MERQKLMTHAEQRPRNQEIRKYPRYGITRFVIAGLFICLASLSEKSQAQIQLPAPGLYGAVAGNNTAGFGGDGGLAANANLFAPTDIVIDSSGNVYIADVQNNRIRKVAAATGIITTVAGNGQQGFSGDGGPATSAAMHFPSGVAVDAVGNIYIADVANDRIREIVASTGNITTVAGNGTQGFSGDNGPATSAELHLNTNTGILVKVAVDTTGNLYIADVANNRIRKVTVATGIITTVAGNGSASFSGDGGAATNAALNQPEGLALDNAGNIYIGDSGNNRVRKVTSSTIL